MRKLLCFAAFLFLSASCEISQAYPPSYVIAGTPGIGESHAPPERTNPAGDVMIEPTAVQIEPTAVQIEALPGQIGGGAAAIEPTPVEIESSGSNAGAEPTPAALTYDGSFPNEIVDPYPKRFQTDPAADGPSDDRMGWYYNRSADRHQPPSAQGVFDIREFDAFYLGDVNKKTVYLTFDNGYEYARLTENILDTLRDKEVPAAFFLTKSYIRYTPDLARRIAADGHIAANHSASHRDFPDLTDEEICRELRETAEYFEEITGYKMDMFFRPPSGVYSSRVLKTAQEQGYKTVFWSFAYVDWETDNQPGREAAFNRLMENLHNGMIILLHAVSSSNAEALPDIIDAVRAQGFEFGALHDLG
ncbi:MAG: polysaccharide deacetylase family protein [Defluviitaleaceae bacterium]|nr:polysaccharide deacetylase family protein [Defluviitaleaceae bacterium]